MKISGVPTLSLAIFVLQLLLRHTKGDVYLHSPRGSNNRLNGEGANRRNAHRLFDSQNNAKGGYNTAEKHQHKSKDWFYMSYLMSGPKERAPGKAGKSYLHIEWTNQHGCGDGDLNCNIVLQYKCQPSSYTSQPNGMRNGQTVATSPYTFRPVYNTKAGKDSIMKINQRFRTGLNEPWEWYDKCFRRDRNRGLFTADQRLRGYSSRFTRQNPIGRRYGYECPEERDYYPYWHPTDWIDIAVLANKKEDCSYYQKESFNVKPKGECMEQYADGQWKHASKYNNPKDCRRNGGSWVEFSNYIKLLPEYDTEDKCKKASTAEVPLIWAIPYRSDLIDRLDKDQKKWKQCLVQPRPLDCRQAPYSRSNHLGNAEGVVPLFYDWVLPYIPQSKAKPEHHYNCVLRIRYNISTNDYNTSDTFSESNKQYVGRVITNESPIVNDPVVNVGVDQLPLQLAINTAQFGRTFEDRSHLFHLYNRAPGIINAPIYNLNVRGKRGNIVQVYPAVEYDFTPKRLEITSDDLVHMQWEGCNTNPGGNAGEGRRQTDRSNIVEMESPDRSYPSDAPSSMFKNAQKVLTWSGNENTKTAQDIAIFMATAGQYQSVQSFLSFYNTGKVPRNPRSRVYKQYAQLDYYPPSTSGLLLKFTKGTYYYMCTRNNNFTNRSQKGRLIVKNSD